MSQLKRADILKDCKKQKIQVKKVMTPEIGKDRFTYVRMLPSSAYGQLSKIASQENTRDQQLQNWFILGVCDKNGKQLFKDSDVKELRNMPLSLLQRCVIEFMNINNIGE